VWAGTGTRDFRDVSVPGLAADVARKMAWSQRRVELPAGRYETMLPPSAVSDLMIYLYWTMEARDADEGRNVFAKPGGGNRVGERLAHRRKPHVDGRSQRGVRRQHRPAVHVHSFAGERDCGGGDGHPYWR